MIFANVTGLVVGLLALTAGVALILRARNSVSPTMLVLIALGLLAFALAMGEPTMRWPRKQTIAVMVDLSPSTRGAAYRDRKWLDDRLKTLLGDVRYDLVNFGDENSRETHFVPVPGRPVVLFSDVQFDLPTSAPPTNVVVDPNLEKIDDAAVVSLQLIGDRAVAEVVNHGPPRALTIAGAKAPTTAPTGESSESAPLAADASAVTARVEGGDRWPENDALTIRVPSPARAERWWIGATPGDASWRSFAPAQLPTDPNAFLNAALVLLDNVPADALSLDQQRRLSQYVRDLGGTLVILGGDHAFASGGYARTTLENLSPLASTPPAPTTHWILLVDSSGSMSASIGASTRFRAAGEAAAQLLSRLPPADLVSVGGFARDLKWWINREPSGKAHETIPPSDAVANGPTNLESSLQAIAQSADRSLPNELLIISDTDAAIADPSALARALSDGRVRASVLSIGESKPNSALAQIATSTGGRFVQQREASQWPQAMRELARSAAPDYLIRRPTDIAFAGSLGFLPKRSANPLNRTWLKDGATSAGTAQLSGETIPAAGVWQLGGGRVVSIATGLPPNDAALVADRLGQLPSDPRMKITWSDSSKLAVRIDATEANAFLNGLALKLQLTNPSTGAQQTQAIPQTGPGEYEVSLSAPAEAMLATITLDARVVARRAVAGHYPREFYPLGNDRAAMQKLADLTGGEVIEPTANRPIDFHWPTRTLSLAPWLAALGALALAGALVVWRRG